jgi:4-amino-4-deoxy-L-arabinose transferase-like glycosyltransferase
MQLRRGLLRRQDTNALILFALVNLPIEFVLSTLSGRVYGHYYVSWMPALAILAASFACFVAEQARQFGKPGQAGAALIALVAALCIGPAWKIGSDVMTSSATRKMTIMCLSGGRRQHSIWSRIAMRQRDLSINTRSMRVAIKQLPWSRNLVATC